MLKALNHDLRRTILRMLVLRDGAATSPSRIATELSHPLSGVGYHFRVLAACEAVTLVSTAPRRGSMEHFYVPSQKFMSMPWLSEALELPADESEAA